MENSTINPTNKDRRFPTEPPVLQPMQELQFAKPDKSNLSNGIEVYGINAGGQDVVRLDIVFDAGRTYEPAHGIASAAARLMREGAAGKSGAEISELAERYGGSIKSMANYDYGTLSIYSLTRNLDKLLPLAASILFEADFPEKEIEIYASKAKQKLSINLQKGEYLADKVYRASLYGADHVYAYRTSPAELDALTTDKLREFQRAHYSNGDCRIFASGRVDDSLYPLLEKYFGSKPLNKRDADFPPAVQSGQKVVHEEKQDAVQSAIRMGMLSIPKHHPDFLKLFVTNTILGGYFGSRLMSNIREDKGYTYGIHSGISHHQRSSHFYISTEVGIDVCKDAVKEIRSELDLLRNEAVSEEELGLVQNYLLGSLMNSVDGPFNTAGTVKGMVLSGLDMSYINQMVDTIKGIKTVDIQEMAQKYLNPADMHEIVVGWPQA